MKRRYRIAERTMEIRADEAVGAWTAIAQNYEPFATADDGEQADVVVEIRCGRMETHDGWTVVCKDEPEDLGMPKVYVMKDPEDNVYVKTIQPQDTHERLVMKMTPDYQQATIGVEATTHDWQTTVSLTAALQVAYYLSTHRHGTLFAHASCVMRAGRAYLFLGKSGTGKSTHSRMWKAAFADTVLLNDDHPIIKVDSDGATRAYGSPWSGKTPCYKNLSAPIGGIVRIRRGESNRIRMLSAVEAYASLVSSVFSAPFDPRQTDVRHRSLERLVATVPCYELWCLPNVDAARVCGELVLKTQNS